MSSRGVGRGTGRGGERGAGRGRGGGRGRGRGAGGRGGPGGQRRGNEWTPKTKLGRLVSAGKVTTFEEIFKFSIPIKEPEIVNFISENCTGNKFKEEVMKVKPVQK